MSLAVAAFRICTVKALDGLTSAGDRVFDSVVDPRDLLGERAEPAIVVYIDAGKRNIQGRELFGAPHTVELTIDSFIARAVAAKAGAGEEQVEFEFAAVDAAYDNYLRCLAYECEKTLIAGDGPWSKLWLQFLARASEQELTDWNRGADASKGLRFAFLRNVYRFEIIDDPTPGQALPPLWDEFLTAVEADQEFTQDGKNLGAYMRKLITSPTAPTWRAAQSELGLIDGVPVAIGIGEQLSPGDVVNPPALAEVDVEDKDTAEVILGDDTTAEVIVPVGG